MSNCDHRFLAKYSFDILLDDRLVRVIQCGSGFVENKQLWRLKHDSC